MIFNFPIHPKSVKLNVNNQVLQKLTTQYKFCLMDMDADARRPGG